MLERIGGNLAAQLFGLGITFADRFIVVALLLRTLGPETYADWTLIVSAASLFSMAELGLNIYYGNCWQKLFAERDTAGFQRIVRTARGFTLIQGFVLAATSLVVLANVDLAAVLSLKTVTAWDAAGIWLLLAAAMILRIMRGSQSQIYRGRNAFAVGTLIDQCFSATLVVVLVVTASAGGGLVALATAYFAADLVAGWGLMFLDMSRRFPDLRLWPAFPRRAELAHLFGHVRWFAILMAAPIVWQQMPLLLLGWNGVHGLSLISFLILRTLVNFARQVCGIIAISCGVELASAFHADERDHFVAGLAAVGSGLSGLAGALAAAIYVFGELFVGLWTGRPELFDRSVMAGLLVALLVSAPTISLSSVTMLCNFPRVGAIANLMQIGTGVTATAFLVHSHGAAGAAAGLAIGEAIGLGLVLPFMATRALRIPYSIHLLRAVFAMLVCGGWGLAAALVIEALVIPRGFAGLALAGVIWATCVAPAFFATLPSRQRQRILNLPRRYLSVR